MNNVREAIQDKQSFLQCIIEQLASDLLMLEQAVALARDTATHADCLGSSKYETMGLEASYLAQGQGTRLIEVERSLSYFKQITVNAYTSEVMCSSMLLLADEQGLQQLLWVAAEAGGLKVHCGAIEVTVITPRSPLGRALMRKNAGDEVEVHIAGRTRHYEILDVY
ncbi:transcription elongation factor GreAB [Mariprofundus sp. EBB-1]|uniref:GreA/GreB family elongation factor n=1 Tax=Mariprofundus sp. EBB-1 TaxID=2650971 RepID=UPI000EF1C405|nr:GreA/GreB family elongation factor [Mariprofundus sp. EBB-1]RLL51262.1 transcription elongation factor GreAB [Mariprofundus sp. EBB-1]